MKRGSLSLKNCFQLSKQTRPPLYEEIRGMTVRDILYNNKGHVTIPELTQFISKLHDKGILFTSLHMDNIIKLESGVFGLIDVSNTHFFYFPLGLRNRARNLCNLLSYAKDIDLMQRGLNTNIVDEYLKHLYRPSKVKIRFAELVKKKLMARQLQKKG